MTRLPIAGSRRRLYSCAGGDGLSSTFRAAAGAQSACVRPRLRTLHGGIGDYEVSTGDTVGAERGCARRAHVWSGSAADGSRGRERDASRRSEDMEGKLQVIILVCTSCVRAGSVVEQASRPAVVTRPRTMPQARATGAGDCAASRR
eukprot:CAMPEP_0177534454 /NCGR_PEP_ID=MMETSP0369-20130122/55963_1 /TAXON_ID=447022 ORGANISM="Scrippsiella hangoei-like, Strain SHHI-4" /NCGR_SAMPLE_ID=MMETSP0369 /ASSEMBLY_ACC=CAM_ASM_000364 /LENGTH=146 /DNA_ID=CAMNT_0019016421 /DNA_START=112 /DNA_END=548 /DNA_ORIENTATION=-